MAIASEWCTTGVQAEEQRERIRRLNQAINERSEGWTLLACTRHRYQQTALVVSLEPLHAAVASAAELLAMPLPTQGRLLIICDDEDLEKDVLTLIAQMRQLHGEARCRFLVCLRQEVPRPRLEQLWRSGADGITCLDRTGDGHLLEAVLALLRGLTCLDPVFSERLRHQSQRDHAAETCLQLNERERQLIRLLAHGRSSAEIAALLQLRADTIRRQLSGLYRKAGVRGQRGLLSWGLEQGLIRPPDLLTQLR